MFRLLPTLTAGPRPITAQYSVLQPIGEQLQGHVMRLLGLGAPSVCIGFKGPLPQTGRTRRRELCGHVVRISTVLQTWSCLAWPPRIEAYFLILRLFRQFCVFSGPRSMSCDSCSVVYGPECFVVTMALETVKLLNYCRIVCETMIVLITISSAFSI